MVSRKKVVLGFLILLLLGAIGYFAPPDDGVVMDARIYCQQVHDHNWPDFHHIYKEQCHKDGSLNEDYVYGR